MLKERFITDALAEVKYFRVTRLTYKAAWSTEDVEHFLYFSLYGTPREFLAAEFGLRNASAEEFGIECVRAYGGTIYQTLRHNIAIDCKMRFSLGKLAGWSPRSSLQIPGGPSTSLAEKIRADVETRLMPIVQKVTTLDRLLSLLINDVEPCPWYRVNGAIRAAQISYIARRLGMRSPEIEAILRRLEREIEASLQKSPNPSSYIDNVIHRSQQIL